MMFSYPNNNNFRRQLYCMQALGGKQQQFMVSIPMEAKETIDSLIQGNITCWDALKPFVDSASEARAGKSSGVIFLNSVYVHGESRKLQQPIPLKVHISDNGMIHLANTEYKILVSCETLQEALEEAMIEYDTMYRLFNDSKDFLSASASAFGKKLHDAVWM